MRFTPFASRLPDRLAMGGQDVHLWAWRLGRSGHDNPRLARLLSEDERDRAARFHEGRDRIRFVAARGMMRELLGRYCGQPAGALRFVYGAQGKPALGGPGPQFSLSRRGDLAILAVSKEAAIGVDIERLILPPGAATILRDNASPAEIDEYARLPAQDRAQSFFCWWTRKEAVVKALGGGLSVPLSCFDVPIEMAIAETPGGSVRRLGGVWTLRHLQPHDGYIGALAFEGTSRTASAWFLGDDGVG
jgi:4'-phosphopantetheinyl transferase